MLEYFRATGSYSRAEFLHVVNFRRKICDAAYSILECNVFGFVQSPKEFVIHMNLLNDMQQS